MGKFEIMSVEKRGYETVQKKAFSQLIDDGCYSGRIQHAQHAQKLFISVISEAISHIGENSAISILDCGCGNGSWLEFIHSQLNLADGTELYGYDLTPGMVQLAQQRLSSSFVANHFHQGNILDADAYQFQNQGAFDLIYTYDVVQQLPRNIQFDACQSILNHLKPQGIAVIFDNDHQSPFGRKMAFRKFVTRYLRIPLVPRYFCNAHYPPLQKFADKIEQLSGRATKTFSSENGMKRALLILPVEN